MEMLSGTNKPTYSSYIMKKHFPFICNLEKYDFSNREMGYNNGMGGFYGVLGVLYFSKQLCFFSAEISGI